MIYSNFTKTWIETCNLCNTGLIDYEKIFKNVSHDKWDIQFLNKYCIIEKKSYKKTIGSIVLILGAKHIC